MSKEANEWAGRQRIADLTLTAVLKALAFKADKGTAECRAPQSEIAQEVGLTDRAVRSALVVLDQLEIISRHERSRGRFGRTSDLVILSIGRNFDVSKATVQAIRKALKPKFQPEPNSGCTKRSNRNQIPLQPEPGSGPYNTGDKEEPYQVRVSTYVEGSSTEGEGTPTDRAAYPSNVIPLMSRGAA